MHVLRSLLPLSGYLVRIATLWGITSTKYPDDATLCQDLIKRMADPIAARFVWEQLNEEERSILWECLGKRIRNSGCHRETVFVRSGLSGEAFDTLVSSLEQALLLAAYSEPEKQGALMLGSYEENAAALYATGREIFFAGAARTDQALDKLLPDLDKADLWSLVHLYQLDSTALTTQADLRKALVHALAGLDIIHASLHKLPPLVQQVLPWLYEQGGCVVVQSVGEAFDLTLEALYTLLRQLEDAGLAFDTLLPGGTGRQLFVPQKLRRDLERRGRALAYRAEMGVLEPLPEPPSFIEEGVPRVAFDLVVAINATYQQRVEVTRSLQVADWCAGRIEPHLMRGRERQKDRDGAGSSYLNLVFKAAEHLRLIQREEPPWTMGIKSFFAPGPELMTWAERSLSDQVQVLLSEWVAGKIWRDIITASFHQWDWRSWRPEAGRTLLLSQLRECRTGAWYSIESLLCALWERDPYVLRPDLKEHAGERHATAVLREKWWRAEGEFLKGVLVSTLWEFGLVSLGYNEDRSGGSAAIAHAFQVTEIGASALREGLRTEGASPVPLAPLIVQGNFEAHLLGYDQEALFHLLPWAGDVQIQQACRLTFTENSIQRAIFHGLHIEPFLQFLVDRSGKELPQGVEYQFRAWAQRYQEVRIAQGIILVVSDEATASHLALAPAFRGFGLIQIAPLVFLAPSHTNVAELRRILEKERVAVHLTQSVRPPVNLVRGTPESAQNSSATGKLG